MNKHHRNLEGPIVIVQRELSHYNIPFYLLLKNKMNVVILYSYADSNSSENIAKSLPELFIKISGFYPFKNNKYVCYLSEFNVIAKMRPKIIIQEFSLSILNTYLLGIFKVIIRSKLVWYSHGYNRCDKSGEKISKRMVRVLVHSIGDANIVYSEGGRNYLVKYGIPKKKVFVAWNSIDTSKLLNEEKKIYKNQKNKSMQNGGNINQISFVFLGRMIKEKKGLLVAKIYVEIFKKYQNSTLHFIGSGPDETLIRVYLQKALEMKFDKCVFFHGEIFDQKQIGEILSKCNILLNPGCLGLNIIPALAYGLPIVATKDGIDGTCHGPEIEYIENTSAFIEVCTNSVNDFVLSCIQLISNQTQFNIARTEALKAFQNISLERMCNGFEEAIKFVES